MRKVFSLLLFTCLVTWISAQELSLGQLSVTCPEEPSAFEAGGYN